MNSENNLYNEPELNKPEKIFFRFYSEKIYEAPESKEYIDAKKNEYITSKKAFIEYMDNEFRKNIMNTKVPETV